jgi:hypothetical protein
MKSVFFLMAAAVAALHGSGQSALLTNTTANAATPQSAAAFLGDGSYWVDFRVTSWSAPPSGCEKVMQVPLAKDAPSYIRVCAPGAGFEPFTVFMADGVPGGNPFRMGPPNIRIASVMAANPMKLTLASAPYPISMSAGKTVTIWGASCAGLDGNRTITAVSGSTVTIDYDGSNCTSYTANSGAVYAQDFVFRMHRDRPANQDIMESWNVDGTGRQILSYPVITASTIALPNTFTIGPGHVAFAFVRWYAGTIAVDAKPPWGSIADAGGAPLTDWEFDGNGKDSVRGWDFSFTQAPTYQQRPVYAPGCNAGAPQSWRAGKAGTLDGSRSISLDGGATLNYVWQQISSAEPGTRFQRVRWNDRRIAKPAVSGFVAGPLNFQLTVTDGSGATASCTVHHGAVATDDAGNVAIADRKTAQILGPMLQWGSGNEPWRFQDDNEKQWADLLGSLQGQLAPGMVVSDLRDVWNVPLAGTVAAASGDYRLYGTGTSFKSDFCHGGNYPASPGDSNIVVWYPTTTVPGGYGRGSNIVGKCVSDTAIDVLVEWSDDDRTSATAYKLDAPPGFGYAAGKTLIWRPGVSCAGGPTTVNVSGLGPVPLKQGDGASDPRPSDCAHSDDVHLGVNLSFDGSAMRITGPYAVNNVYRWQLPSSLGMQYSAFNDATFGSWINGSANINYYDNVMAFYALYYRTGIDTYLGYARWLADKWWTMPYYDSGNAGNLAPRVLSYTGMVLRAIDQDNVAGAAGASPMWPGLRRLVDANFRPAVNTSTSANRVLGDLRETAYNNMWLALCAAYDPDTAHAAACRADLNQSIVTTWKPQRHPDGFWQGLAGTVSSMRNTWDIVPQAGGTVTVTPGSKVVTLTGGVWSSSMFPTRFFSVGNFLDVATRDSAYYNATYVDAQHIQLDRPYTDACAPLCSGRQWVIGQSWVGFGVQPFMLGIAGQFFNQSYLALGMDNQYADTAALAKSYVVDIANWLVKYGVEPGMRGLWYAVGFGSCDGPNPKDPSCDGGLNSGGGIVQVRELNPEVLGTLAIAYTYSPTSTLRVGIDDLFSAVYAKYPADPGYDGIYAADMDGFNLARANAKWLGFYWGMGRNAAWPSARQGGLIADQTATVFVQGDPQLFGRAAAVQARVTEPTGEERQPVVCRSLPCAVTVNRTLGNPLIQMVYLAADGSPLATGEAIAAPVK